MENKPLDHTDGKREKDLLVEKENVFMEREIYSSDISVKIGLGAAIGAIILGAITWLIAAGTWPIPYLGQFSASGDGVAAIVGAGIGAAMGGLIGGIISLSELKKRNS